MNTVIAALASVVPLMVRVGVPVCPATGSMVNIGGVVSTKVAVTFLAVSMITVQAFMPVHAPDQPAKVEPEVGEAERVTVLKIAN